MYIIRGRAGGLITYKPRRAIRHKSITVPTAGAEPNSGSSKATIDIEQSGSGIKGVKNKLSQIGLHTDGKKKFNKFISLNL